MQLDKKECLWQQVVIRDPSALSGQSVLAILRPIIESCGLGWALATEIEATSRDLQALAWKVLPASEFLDALSSTVQFDWAFIFFYRAKPDEHLGENELSERDLIETADLTVRLADDTYLYLYTENVSFLPYLAPNSLQAEFSVRRLKDLEILD